MSEQTERNKAIVRRYQDAYNSGDLDALDDLLAPDWVSNNWPPILEQSIDNAKVIHQMLMEVFPDLHVATEALIAEDDLVVQRFTVRGTHNGEIVGLAPTGNHVSQGGVSIFRIAGGKIVEHLAFQDSLDFVHQCGADLPEEWLVFIHH